MIYRILGLALATTVFTTTPSFANTISMITDYGTSGKTKATGTIEGIHKQASLIYENPASLAEIPRYAVSAFYTMMADQESAYISVSTVLPYKKYRIGLGFTRLGVPNLDHTGKNDADEYYVQDGFQTSESLYKACLSYPITPFASVGASAHYYRQDFYTVSGGGFNADVGASLHFEKFSSSFSLKNILRPLHVTYTEGAPDYAFPLQAVLSNRLQAFSFLSLYSQFKYVRPQNYLLPSFGLEIVPPRLNNLFHLYAGWKQTEVASLVTSRVSLGLGLILSDLEFHFVYEPTVYLENTSLYGVSLNLNL